MERYLRSQLCAELARRYRADVSVQSLLDAAEVRNQELISWASRPIDTWHAVLTHLEIQEQLQAVLDVVIAQFPKDAVFHQARYHTLLRPDPKVKIPQYSGPLLDRNAAEAIMDDESTLLPINFLKQGIDSARAVARVVLGTSVATGFLTSNDIFITNNHVIATQEHASKSVLEFGYDNPVSSGEPRAFTPLTPCPSKGFYTDSKTDITMVRVPEGTNAAWGGIPLEPVDLTDVRFVNIIQHPNGGSKMLGIYHNVLAYHDSTAIEYYTDTLPGSSGSPVLESSWRLVGIHRGSGLLSNPNLPGSVNCNRGASIDALLEALEFFLHSAM